MFERFINPDRGADKYEIELDDGDVRVMSAADEVGLSNGSRVKVVDLKGRRSCWVKLLALDPDSETFDD